MIMAGCACHLTGTGALDMSTKMIAYTNLVGVDSRSCTGVKRVVANQPEQSVLYLAVTHTSQGSCMPPVMPAGGMTMWDQEKLDKLKAWINAGAKND